MKVIKEFENRNLDRTNSSVEYLKCYHAYQSSLSKGFPLITFIDIIDEFEVPAIVEVLKSVGVDSFVFGYEFTGYCCALKAFQDYGCHMKEVVSYKFTNAWCDEQIVYGILFEV